MPITYGSQIPNDINIYAKRYWMDKSEFAKFGIIFKNDTVPQDVGKQLVVEREVNIDVIGKSAIIGTLINMFEDMVKELVKKEQLTNWHPRITYTIDLNQQRVPSLAILHYFQIETMRMVDSINTKFVMFESIGSPELCQQLNRRRAYD